MARPIARRPGAEAAGLPACIHPQLTEPVKEPPDGPDWLHEIKYDGYRVHARLDHSAVRLLTRTGLDWTHKYSATAVAVASLGATQAYLDGELCGVRPDGITFFSIIQLASDSGNAAPLEFLPCSSGDLTAPVSGLPAPLSLTLSYKSLSADQA